MATTIEGVDFSAQIARLLALETWRNNRVSGLVTNFPLVASTQGSGAVAPVGRFRLTGGDCCFKGLPYELAEPLEYKFTDLGWPAPPVLAVGQTCVAAFVIYQTSATDLALLPVFGTPGVPSLPALWLEELVPTDAQIRATLAATAYLGNTDYLKLGATSLKRTADTVVQDGASTRWREGHVL